MRLLKLLVVIGILSLAGCVPGGTTPRAAPTIRTEGQGVRCAGDDHAVDEVQFGWSWCYPKSWKFQERLQPTGRPKGVDATFDIVNDLPKGTPGSGDFGFLIVGTYDIGPVSGLREWVTANIGPDLQLTSFTWANAREALVDGDGRRYALTAHHVVELDVRGPAIAGEMVKRLDRWRFY